MSASLAAHQGGAVFARMARNLAWLLGGRGFQAVASLLYLGLAARTLGPARFGEFTLVLAYGQAIANVAQFQSWQTVIRYGTIHIVAGARDRLGRLLGLTTLFDCGGAILGAIAAAAGLRLPPAGSAGTRPSGAAPPGSGSRCCCRSARRRPACCASSTASTSPPGARRSARWCGWRRRSPPGRPTAASACSWPAGRAPRCSSMARPGSRR
ncbi:lipopolysaccharide biosynthesis protein [Rhizorhabdus histidinilytica]